MRRQQDPPRAAIIGGGPLGLEAALFARHLGHHVHLFEREPEVAADVRAWAHVPMFTPWSENRSALGERELHEAGTKIPVGRVYPTGAEFLSQYLEPLAKILGGSLLLETRVVAVGRSYLFADDHADAPEKRTARRFRLLTRNPLEERIQTADYVIDATGVTHSPRWLGAGGLPALGEMGASRQILYSVPDVLGRDRIRFLGKRALLIGDGTSAATTALAIMELLKKDPAGSLVWVSKSRADLPLPLRENDPLTRRDTLLKKATLLLKSGHPRLEYLPITQVEAVSHSLGSGKFQVTLQVNHQTQRVTVDTVVANVGYRADLPAYERVLHPNEPGIYVIGQKAGVSGEFFLPEGRRQIQEAFRAITGLPDLDLYADVLVKPKTTRKKATVPVRLLD